MNKNEQLKLLFSTLEHQLPGRRVYSSTLNSYNDIFERSNNQFDQSIAPDVTFYFTKTLLSLFGSQVFESVVQDLCLNKYTPTTTRIGYNNIVSAANEIELAFIINRDNKTILLGAMAIRDNDAVSTASKIELVPLEMLIITERSPSLTSSSTQQTSYTHTNKPRQLRRT